jgi:hypothetical protein
MKEVALLLVGALSSVAILGYSVHMLIGGVVGEETERWIITGVCVIGAGIVSFMGYDIVRARRRR